MNTNIDFNDNKEMFIIPIKNELVRILGMKNITINKLRENINNKYNCNLNPSTFAKCFSLLDNNLNSQAFIAICLYWNINILDFFDRDIYEADTFNIQLDIKNFSYLTDAKYNKNYYCYIMPRNNINSKEIWLGNLSIYIENNKTKAKFTIDETDCFAENNNNSNETRKTYLGEVIYSKISKNLILDLKSDLGSYVYITFAYEPYVNDSGMYYRNAIFLSYAIDNSKSPRVQKMIILDHMVTSVNANFLFGLLKMNLDTVIISKDRFEHLCKENVNVNRFYEKFQRKINLTNEDCYFIETKALEDYSLEFNTDDIYAIMCISANSVSKSYMCVETTGIYDKIARISKQIE